MVNYKVGDTIEFNRKSITYKGNVISVVDECTYINIFAIMDSTGTWRHMGVYNETPIPNQQISKVVIEER